MGEGWVWRGGGGHRSKRGVVGGEVSVGPHRPDRCLACCVKLLGQQRRNTRRSRDVSTGSCRNRTDTESSGEKYLVSGEKESPVARRRKGGTLSMIPSGGISVGNAVTRASEASSTSIDIGTFQKNEETENEDDGSKSVIRKEILKYIMRMSNPLWWKLSRQTLLLLKQKHPQSFQDVCLYSEVSACLGSASYRLISRHFIQELFFDLTFDELYEQSANILHLTEPSGASVASGTSSALPTTPHSVSSPSQVEAGQNSADSSEHQSQTHNLVHSPVKTSSGFSNIPPVSLIQMSPSGVRTISGLPSLAEEEMPCDSIGSSVGKSSMPKDTTVPKADPQPSPHSLSSLERNKTVSETSSSVASLVGSSGRSTEGGKCGFASGTKLSVVNAVGDKSSKTISVSSAVGYPSSRITSEVKVFGDKKDSSHRDVSGPLAAKNVGNASDKVALPGNADEGMSGKKLIPACTSCDSKVETPPMGSSKVDVAGKMVLAGIPRSSGERQGTSVQGSVLSGGTTSATKTTGNTIDKMPSAANFVGNTSSKVHSTSNISDGSSHKVLSATSTVNDTRVVMPSVVSLTGDGKMPTASSGDSGSCGKVSSATNALSDVSTKVLSRTNSVGNERGKTAPASSVPCLSEKCNVASISGIVSISPQVPTSTVLSTLTATCSVVASQSSLVATKTSSLTKPTSSAITLPSSCIMPTLNVSVRSSSVSQPVRNEEKSNVVKRKSLEKKLVNR